MKWQDSGSWNGENRGQGAFSVDGPGQWSTNQVIFLWIRCIYLNIFSYYCPSRPDSAQKYVIDASRLLIWTWQMLRTNLAGGGPWLGFVAIVTLLGPRWTYLKQWRLIARVNLIVSRWKCAHCTTTEQTHYAPNDIIPPLYFKQIPVSRWIQ